MLTERDLLLDIIQNAPENSVWNISSDSWKRIPEVFSKFISLNDVDDDYDWDITINKDNREEILKIIGKEEIYDKIVHQKIMLNCDTIFQGYDYMISSFLKKTFPCFDYLIKKYEGQEIELLELT